MSMKKKVNVVWLGGRRKRGRYGILYRYLMEVEWDECV